MCVNFYFEFMIDYDGNEFKIYSYIHSVIQSTSLGLIFVFFIQFLFISGLQKQKHTNITKILDQRYYCFIMKRGYGSVLNVSPLYLLIFQLETMDTIQWKFYIKISNS